MKPRALAAALALAASAPLAAPPRAAPAQTRWDDVREPRRRRFDADLAEAERLMALRGIRRDLVSVEGVREARAVFARVVAAWPDHVPALHGLGAALDAEGEAADLAGDVGLARRHYAAAADALARARAAGPASPELPDVLFLHGVVLTRLRRFADAREAYELFVTMPVGQTVRGVATCNLAEMHVYLGDIAAALRTYRACIELLPNRATGYWGLAVASDRDAREADAQRAAARALALDPQLHDLIGEGVFFVPEYEVEYYLGVAHEARALEHDALGESSEALVSRDHALQHWRRYLRAAAPDDRWVARARAHEERLAALLAPPAPQRGRRAPRR